MGILRKIKSAIDVSDFNFVITCFVTWWLFLLLVSLLVHTYNRAGDLILADLLQTLANWDGGNFLEVSKNGYSNHNLAVFFPLYPTLIATVANVFNLPHQISGVLISQISFFLALLVLFKLVKNDFSLEVAKKSVSLLMLFPTSFFFAAIYSESLYLLTVVLAFYYFRKKNALGIYLSIIAAILASLTRLTGLVIVITIILIAFKHNLVKKWFSILSLIGLIVYILYLYQISANGFLFLTAEAAWGRSIAIPIFSIWDSILFLITFGFNLERAYILTDILFTIFGIGLAIKTYKLLPKLYGYFTVGSVLLPLLTSNLISIPRFLVVIFPLFVTLATIESKTISRIYILLSFSLLSIFWVAFNLGFWVS